MFGSDTMAEARSMPQLVIVTPALRDANNGNWQTAQRWQRHLRDRYAVRIVRQWPSALACDDAAMIALHARRSADSIAAWAARHPQRGLAVVLTGTDLYRDIAVDASAQRSLQLARTLVVLQEAGPAALAPELRGKCSADLPIHHAAQDAAEIRKTPACRDGRPLARRKVPGDPVRRRAPAGRRTRIYTSTTSAKHSTRRWAEPRKPRWPPRPITAGWAACRTRKPGAASSAPTC
jgi:hypothetical protein